MKTSRSHSNTAQLQNVVPKAALVCGTAAKSSLEGLVKSPWKFNRACAAGGVIAVLLSRAALGQTIPNPSFEADTFTTYPG